MSDDKAMKLLRHECDLYRKALLALEGRASYVGRRKTIDKAELAGFTRHALEEGNELSRCAKEVVS